MKMYVLQNVSPFGDLMVALVFREQGVIKAGQEFEVTAEQAEQLLLQPTNFAPADGPAGEAARGLLAQLEADPEPAAQPVEILAADDPTQTTHGAEPAGRRRPQRNVAGSADERQTQ